MELFTNIQSWWELPSIAHFCSLFRAAFDLLDFDIEELEEAIITDGLDGSGSPLLVELLVRLLQGCLPGRTVTAANVDSCLRKLFRQKSQETTHENLFPEGEFRHLPLRRKVEVLHTLCDFRLEADDVLDLLKNLETESLRIEPLGYDDRGSTYWYFYGTRLYREDHSLYHPFRRRPRDKDKDKDDKKKKKRKRRRENGSPSLTEGEEEYEDEEERDDEPKISWQVECYTEEDWKELAERFSSCESRLEKSLHQTLKEDFLPEIPRLFEEKEKIQQKRMMEFAPRRSSGRVQKMKEKKEEEERKLAEEVVEQEKRRIQEEEKRRLEEAQIEKKRMQDEEHEKKKVEEEEKQKVQDEEKRKLSEVRRRLHNKKERKRRKTKEDSSPDNRVHDIEEDILHERNLSEEVPVPLPLPYQSPSPSKPKQRKHKEKKIHHRKHHGHRKKLHGSNHAKNHALSLLNTLNEDNLIVSDTSNKENNCLMETLSENEEPQDTSENGGRPQVYSGRKTNNSLSSMAFSLSPATVVPEHPSQIVTSPPNKRRVKSVHSLLQTADDLKTGMYKVLEHLRDHEDAWPFLDPVDDTFAPNYYAVIRRPMYISKMESRLDNEYYANLSMFEADFKLMMDNCKLYNGPDSEYTHMAYTLEKVFAKLRSKYLETDFSSDEEIYIDMSFQDSSKRKNKKRSSTDDNDKDSPQSNEKKKRGRKKKKVGRKPKERHEEAPPTPDKFPRKPKGRKPKEKEKEKKSNKNMFKYSKDSITEENTAYKEEEEKHERDVKLNDDKDELEEEDDDDDEDSFEGPLLLVREDPYPEQDEENLENRDDSTCHDDSPGVSDDEDEVSKNVKPENDYRLCNGYQPKKWTSEDYEAGGWDLRMGELADIVDEDDEEEEGEEQSTLLIQKVYNHQSNKKKKELIKSKEKPIEIKKKKSKSDNLRKSKSKIKHRKTSEKRRRSKSGADSVSALKEGKESSPILKDSIELSHSDADSDRDGVLLYYSNNEDNSDGNEVSNSKKDSSCSEKHSELFGEIDDIEQEDEAEDKENLSSTLGSGSDLDDQQRTKQNKKASALKEKKKHKHGEKHHHHHHHHHKSKSKESKHHHHHHHKKKVKHISGKESPSKKVLKVEEVWDVSEEDRNMKDAREIERNLKMEAEDTKIHHEPPICDTLTNSSMLITPPGEIESHKASSKKRKIRHKTKHDKHSKHEKKKEGKEKAKSVKKEGKKKTPKKKKKVLPAEMSAIDALSAATEQTLKDITHLLDDPDVPRFTGESPGLESSSLHKVTSQEFEDIALKIETDYKRKLKMDSTEDKKVKKKKKRKAEDDPKGENSPKKKKIKKEKPPCDPSKDEKEKENRADNGSLDSLKEMFKDIKDGRIKPGAIIKSKDIAKKEGVVKKESKTAIEGKPKGKQNPFGKINKQENSKLTTLIAKAKESRIGLVPNSEVGDSPKLSLGSIILFGDIGSGKHSSREPNSGDEEEKVEKLQEKIEKWDSPWENRWEKPDTKDESSLPPPSISVEEEEEKEEPEESREPSPERQIEEIAPPMTPRAPEIKQEKATPNLSAWFRAFGGPKLTAAPRKRMDGRTDDDEDDDLVDDDDRLITSEHCPEDNDEVKDDDDDDDDEEIDVEDRKEINEDDDEREELNVEDRKDDDKRTSSPETIPEDPPPSPQPVINNSPEPPLSPEKPPETPWIDKLEEKGEEEPIWKNNKNQDEEDPYKFEEEELDRAREEAKKLEVERQRKASVSSSGLSDPSPLNIDSDRSPAAFSSEGERSPMTKSPATRSPVTPGFGGTPKQISPVTEKSPTIHAYSPRYDSGISKGFSSYEGDKNKYPANGSLKVSFYQDMSDKSSQDKTDANKSLEQKAKESPIYSPTVPYVSPFYSNKEASLCKQKSPGRYGNFYSSTMDAPLDKPKTPVYYSASAPSTPSDRPSPAAPLAEDKPKNQYNYYNYDPTKPLTDQYKSTGSNVAKPFYGSNDTNVKNIDQSPIGQRTPLHGNLNSPVSLGLPTPKTPIVPDKIELPPPKKRQIHEKMSHQQSNSDANGHPCSVGNISSSWTNKTDDLNVERNMAASRNQYQQHPLPANLANLSQIVSRIPEPESDYSHPEKELRLAQDDNLHANPLPVPSKTVQQSSLQYGSTGSLTQPSPDLQPLLSRSTELSRSADHNHSSLPDIPKNPLLSHQQNLSQLQSQPSLSPSHLLGKQISPAALTQPHQALSHLPPPAAHQKILEVERPGSRNMLPPHPDEKPHGYLHQKTMWTSSLPQSIPSSLSSSLSSLVSSATMASFALAGQKGFGSISSEHLAQLGIGDRAALASFANRSSQNGSNIFSHDLLPRTTQSQTSTNSSSSVGVTGQSFNSGGSHSRISSSSSSSNSSSISTSGSSTNNFDLGLARSYASIMSASQSSPLLVRSDGTLPRSLPGSSSPFLSQSPGLGAALGMPTGSSRTPTPAHQQSLPQPNFASIPRDPRDPISQSHPSLQIPSLNSIASSQAPGLSHLNAASLTYSGRDSLALMNQGGRAPLVGTAGGLVDHTQQFYQQYLQRHQQLMSQEELLFRSGAHSQIAAHQSMMLQQGLMSAAAAGYPSGYPHSLGLRSGTYQGMNRPWI